MPIKMMLTLDAFWKGLVLGAVPGILCKVVSGVAARGKWKSEGEKLRASQASIMLTLTLTATPTPTRTPTPTPPLIPNPSPDPHQASIMTRFGLVQPIQYLVGMAMVARGEFAFLVAYSASTMQIAGEPMLRESVYAALTWALVWALIFAPFLFKWALGVYMRATPIQRGQSIGGELHGERNFVIQVTPQPQPQP